MSSATISQDNNEYFMIPKEICQTRDSAIHEAQEFLLSLMLDGDYTFMSITETENEGEPCWMVSFTPVVHSAEDLVLTGVKENLTIN